MTTKNKTNTTKQQQEQAVEATSTEQAAQTTGKGMGTGTGDGSSGQAFDRAVQTAHEGQETPEQKVERLKKELADAKAVTKAVKTAKVKTPCAKAGCKLFAMEGRADQMCSNHRPEWDKLTQAEHEEADKFMQQMDVTTLVEILGAHGIRQLLKNSRQQP